MKRQSTTKRALLLYWVNFPRPRRHTKFVLHGDIFDEMSVFERRRRHKITIKNLQDLNLTLWHGYFNYLWGTNCGLAAARHDAQIKYGKWKKKYTKINQNQIYVTRGGGGAGETIKILGLIINKIGCTILLYNLSYLSYPHKQIMSSIIIFLLHRASERCASRRADSSCVQMYEDKFYAICLSYTKVLCKLFSHSEMSNDSWKFWFFFFVIDARSVSPCIISARRVE